MAICQPSQLEHVFHAERFNLEKIDHKFVKGIIKGS